VPLAAVLIGVGELFLAGALPALVNALAPALLRGRYNAALTVVLTSGMWISPLLTTAAEALDQLSVLFLAAAVALTFMAHLKTPPLNRPPAGGEREHRRSETDDG